MQGICQVFKNSSFFLKKTKIKYMPFLTASLRPKHGKSGQKAAKYG
jgi:hypothetical protein